MNTRIMCASALLVCASPLVSAQQSDPAQTPEFRTGVELVSVDVGVLDRQGQPVRGLGPSEFVVMVGGQPRRVVSAEFIEAAAEAPARAARPEVATVSTNEGSGIGRQVVFVVDQATLESGSVRQVARAAGAFLDRLTFADRSGLILMPLGPNVAMTWAHARVRDGLQRVTGQANLGREWEFGSLGEARDIASRNPMVLRTVAERECRGSLMTSGGGQGGGGLPTGGSTTGDQGQGQPSNPGGTTEGGTGGAGGTAGTGTSGGGGGGSRPGGGGFGGGASTFGGGSNGCIRDIQVQADMAWRGLQMTSLSSLAALRQVLDVLGRIPGDKTVILISGGWPMDEREQTATLQAVAASAASARASVFTLYVPASRNSATRRTLSLTPRDDEQVESWPLDTLAGMAGGASFRVDVGADPVFERLGRELAGYYRIGIEKAPIDLDGKARRMKVQVSRNGARVRAREIFDARTYEDRDWTARMASALDAPVPLSGVGLRVTSYLSADPDGGGGVKVMLAGEASRLRPGQASFKVVVRDMEGKEVLLGEQPLGDTLDGRLPFATNIPLAPGSYVVRMAVMDSAGRVGSVDHRVEARLASLGALSAAGPMLVRMPSRPELPPRLALDGVRQDERLALQVDLDGDRDRLAGTRVVFEIAASADGPALVTAEAALSAGANDRAAFAQGMADVRVLPPGSYVARATIKTGEETVGVMRRAFAVLEAPRIMTEATMVASAMPTPTRNATRTPIATRAARSAPAFAIEQVIAPQVLGEFLGRASAGRIATSPAVRALLDRAGTVAIGELEVPDTMAAESPAVAFFFEGIRLLAGKKPGPAADAFRRSLRAASDFYPAMVYLGACFAASGQEKEAAGAWRTALIKEGDAIGLHLLLVDSLLRQGRGDLALEAVERARVRWPDDDGLKRRFVTTAITVGRTAEALLVIDDLVQRQADDEPLLALALLALYDAFMHGRPIAGVELDRARMLRLAEVYRARGGPSLALVDTWVSASARKR